MIKTLFEKAPQEKGPFQYLVAVWDSSKRGFLATVPAKRFRFEKQIKTLNQRITTTYRLPIAIEHALSK